MRDAIEPFVSIVTLIVGVAIVAVLVSRNSQTGNVLAAFGGMVSNMLSAATGPVTGASTTANVNAGTSSGGFGGLGFGSTQPMMQLNLGNAY